MPSTPWRRNAQLAIVFQLGVNTPLYWPYMFHLVTVVRGLSATEFGWLKSLTYLTTIVCEVPSGMIADRFGRKQTLLVGAILVAVGCLGYVLASSFWMFAMAEIVLGMSGALLSGADSAFLYDSLVADQRALEYPRAEGQVRMAQQVGFAIGLPLTDLLLLRDGDPTLAYLAAGLMAVLAAVSALWMTEPPARERLGSSRIVLEAVRDVAHAPGIGRIILYGIGVYLMLRAGNAILFDPILSELGTPVNRYGRWLAGISIGAALVAWGTHRALTRLGEPLLLLLLPVSLVAMYLLLMRATTPAPLLLMAIGSGGFNLMIRYALNRRISASSHRATVLSLQSVACRGTYALGVVCIGSWLDSWTLEYVLAATVALGCIPFAVMWLLPLPR